MKMKKRTRPDADAAPQAVSPMDELFDASLFEDDEDLSVESILAEFQVRDDRDVPTPSNPPAAEVLPDPPAEAADAAPQAEAAPAAPDAPASDPSEPGDAEPNTPEPDPSHPADAESNIPEPTDAEPDASEAADAQSDAQESDPSESTDTEDDFEPSTPEELADAEAAAVSMKSDILGKFRSVINVYHDLGIRDASQEEKSSVKSMLKRWDLLAVFQRERKENSTTEGVSAAALAPDAADTADTPDVPAADAAPEESAQEAVYPPEPPEEAPVSAPAEAKADESGEPASPSRLDVLLKKVPLDAAKSKLQALSARLPKRKQSIDAETIDSETIRDTDADNSPSYAAPLDDDIDTAELRPGRNRNIKAAVTGYLIAFLAAIDALRDKSGAAMLDFGGQVHDPEDDREDMNSAKASRLYGMQARRIRPRAQIASVLALLLLAVSIFQLFGIVLPAFLADIRTLALLCLVLQLAVMLVGIDIFATGIYNLIDAVPGLETLVSISCLASAVDALLLFLNSTSTFGLPFSAVSALSMAFALWGSYFYCLGYRLSFRTLTQIQTPIIISSETGLSEQSGTLLRSCGAPEHFIKRSEAPDLAESAYRLFTPLFLIVSLIFGLLSSVGHGGLGAFVHCFSACIAACAAFPAFLCFAKPFAEAARKLRRKGCAVAGFAGCREIGSANRVVVYDEDLFPHGTVTVEKVIASSELLAAKLTIYTTSLLHESQSSLTPAFDALLTRKGFARMTVRAFIHQEGGGYSGFINEEQVLVGPAAYLDLMGIRVPQRLKDEASVFTAINGQLAGAFCLEYITTTASRQAFSALFRSRYHPLFVVRDFNVTPVLIQQKFGAPPSRFSFPSFSDRHRIAAVQAENPPSAVLSKNEIRPLTESISICQELYQMTRRAVLVSLTASVVGLLAAFLLCCLGKFQVISAAVLSIFMLLWLIPSFIFSPKRK